MPKRKAERSTSEMKKNRQRKIFVCVWLMRMPFSVTHSKRGYFPCTQSQTPKTIHTNRSRNILANAVCSPLTYHTELKCELKRDAKTTLSSCKSLSTLSFFIFRFENYIIPFFELNDVWFFFAHFF